MIATTTPPNPTDEHGIQVELFRWLARHPDKRASLAYAIPNGGYRSKRTGQDLQAEGLRSGVPDIHLPVACGQYHSLYIEVKRPKTDKQRAGQVKEEQWMWIKALREQGHMVEVCYWLEEAQQVIDEYLALDTP